METRPRFRSLAAAFFLAQGAAALAAPIIFQGVDFGTGAADPHPNSDATAASFKLAIGAFSITDFESTPVGDFVTLGVNPGVSVTLTGTAPDGGISTLSSSTLGFNTTPGGSKFLHLSPPANTALAAAVFSFATPVNSFGSYLTGLGSASGNLHVAFNDGADQDFSVVGNPAGGVQFFGFIVHSAPVPEPATLCFGFALFGACLGARRRARG